MRPDEIEDGILSEAEAEAARSLADAVDGGDGTGADAEALAVVRLLASLRELPGDDLAALRGAVGAANALRAATRRRRAVRLLVPLAAALVLAAGIAGSRRGLSARVSNALLATREAEARVALEGLTTDSSGFRTAHAGDLLAGLSANRFDTYRRERSTGSVADTATQPSSTRTPSGGRS